MLLAGVLAFLSGGAALLWGWKWAIVAALCLPWCLFIPFFRQPSQVFGLAVTVVVLLTSAFYQRFSVNPVLHLIGESDTVVGQVTARNGCWYTFTVDRAEKIPAGTRVLLYCRDRCAPKVYETVQVAVKLDAVPQAKQSVYADRVFLAAYPATYGEEQLTVVGGPATPTASAQFRQRLVETIRSLLPGRSGELIAAICLGERQSLSAVVTEGFRRCGISHLLALSGLHMSVLIGGVFFLLRRVLRIPRQIVPVLSGGVVALFVWTVGACASVSRAAIMCFVLLFGQLIRERSDGLNSLGFAFCCLQFANPYCLYDAGVWLSFGATAGVLGLVPHLSASVTRLCDRLPSRLRCLVRRPLELLTVTTAALLPILPVSIYLFRSVALLTPIANLLTVLPTEVVLLCSFAALVMYYIPGFRFIGKGLFFIAGSVARLVLTVTHWLAQIPEGLWMPGRFWVMTITGCGAVLLAAAILMHSRTAVIRTVALTAVLAVIGTGTDALYSRRYATVEMTTDAVAAIVSYGGHTVVLAPTAEALKSVGYSLEDGEHRQIDALIIGSGETTDVPYLTRLLQTYPRTEVLLTGETAWCDATVSGKAVGASHTVSLFSDAAMLTAVSDDWWLFRFRDTRLLMAAEGADATELLPEMRQSDGLLTAGSGPTHAEELHVSVTYWLTSEEKEEKLIPFPAQPDKGVYITRQDRRVLTAGNGDWRL